METSSQEHFIRPIDDSSIKRICSGQVVSDLSSTVKELIENSIDAGATSIDLRLKEMGLESVELADNGAGIDVNDHEFVALKHFTSKISTFADVKGVKSFGFRGEAVSAICELSKSFSITTKTAHQSVGSKLRYSRDGKYVICMSLWVYLIKIINIHM